MVCIVDVDVDVNDEGIDFGVQPQSLSCWKKVSELKEEKITFLILSCFHATHQVNQSNQVIPWPLKLTSKLLVDILNKFQKRLI